TSASTEKVSSMERLEFLGDRILGLVISEELFRKYPGLKEGELSKKYSFLVQRSTCAKVAENISLNKFIILGKSELKNSQIKSSILSNIMEALIGSIFLDSDYSNTRKIVLKLWKEMISSVEKANNLSNSKSDLQEKILSMNKKLPNYKLISIQGEDHDPRFTISVSVDGFNSVLAIGKSKQEAEKNAAEKMLKIIENE
ncbi:MAG: ribonuclease III, partial [Pseudomonadota bacterium]|nr:ribonuclease III [Pseudomonadota bacterium]